MLIGGYEENGYGHGSSFDASKDYSANKSIIINLADEGVFAKPAILLFQASAIWKHATSQSFVSPLGQIICSPLKVKAASAGCLCFGDYQRI